jgi:hypothetical protein
MCTTCATEKLIMRPSPLKIQVEPLKFLERIQRGICGPTQPLSGPFRYFMGLIDTSTRWSYVCLLSTHNHAEGRREATRGGGGEQQPNKIHFKNWPMS